MITIQDIDNQEYCIRVFHYMDVPRGHPNYYKCVKEELLRFDNLRSAIESMMYKNPLTEQVLLVEGKEGLRTLKDPERRRRETVQRELEKAELLKGAK